jgi:hypothetical protein
MTRDHWAQNDSIDFFYSNKLEKMANTVGKLPKRTQILKQRVHYHRQPLTKTGMR